MSMFTLTSTLSLSLQILFFDNTTATSTDMRTVITMATNVATTTAAITLTGGPPPPLPLSSMETISPGVESVGRVFSLGVEESGTIILVVEEATGSKVIIMGFSEVDSGSSALVGCSSVFGSGVVGSLVVGRSASIVVVGGGVIGHGGGVGEI